MPSSSGERAQHEHVACAGAARSGSCRQTVDVSRGRTRRASRRRRAGRRAAPRRGSAIRSTSSRFWVAKTTAPAAPPAARRRASRAAAAGRGRARRSARRAAARPGRRAARWRGSAAGGCRPRGCALGDASPGSSNAASSRSAAARGSCSPSSRANSSRFSRADRRPYCAGRCGAQPTRRPCAARPCPLLGSSAPASSASSVDLPAPFGPTSASASPSQTSSSTGSSALVWPNRRPAPRAASSGARAVNGCAAAGGIGRRQRRDSRLLHLDLHRNRAALLPMTRAVTRSPKNSQIAAPDGQQRQRDEDARAGRRSRRRRAARR